MEIQQISTLLRKCVNIDDVIGAKSLLGGVNEQDRKMDCREEKQRKCAFV